MFRPALLPLCTLLVLTACSSGEKPVPEPSGAAQGRTGAAQQLPVKFEPTGGTARTLMLEAALTPEAQQQGLSGRKELRADGGMIFPFLPPRPASFWMKDTLIPLDMIFVRTNGTIDLIAHNAKPMDLTPISTGNPVVAVVELPGGRAKAMRLKEGDRISWGECAQKTPEPVVQTLTDYCPPR